MTRPARAPIPRPVTPAVLVKLFSRLPLCIQEHALGEPPDPQEMRELFTYDTATRECGERLVELAALASGALYLHFRASTPSDFPEDGIFPDYLKTLVFGEGFHKGLAHAIIQRAGRIPAPPFDGMTNTIPITCFTDQEPVRPSNFLRDQLDEPIQDRLAQLIQALEFMQGFSFGAAPQQARFRGVPIALAPFLLWDGRTLAQFRALDVDDAQACTLEAWTPDGPITLHPEQVGSRLKGRLIAVAELLEVATQVFDGRPSPGDEGRPTSIIPQLAETDSRLTQLAQMLYVNANKTTKQELFCPKGVPGREVAESRHEIAVTNEILRSCLEQDPVSVLERYLTMERGDAEVYFHELSGSVEEADRLVQDIEDKRRARQERLRPFYCTKRHRQELSRYMHGYRARLEAQQIVRLLGFPMSDPHHEDDIVSYAQRVLSFRDFVERDLDDPERETKINAGLGECAKEAERILRFLIIYYRALPHFDPDQPGGLTSAGLDVVETWQQKLDGRGFGTLLGYFKKLTTPRVLRGVTRVLDREALWPEGSEVPHLEALDLLNKERLARCHPPDAGETRPGSGESPLELIKGFQGFLDWLRDPLTDLTSDRRRRTGRNALRIYPAIVAIDVVTTTKSSITSLRYMLRTLHGEDSSVVLYTMQPLSVKCCYYGLPHRRKISPTFWKDPALIETDLLSGGQGGA